MFVDGPYENGKPGGGRPRSSSSKRGDGGSKDEPKGTACIGRLFVEAYKAREQQLAAEVRKQADAEKYKRQQEAEAEFIERQRKADAELVEQQKRAEAEKALAEAALYRKQKEAEGIAAVGKAEAEAIAAKGIAEAEAMEKKAEAMKKYGQAAITEMIVKQLPSIAEAVAKPISTIDKVTIIDSGNGESGVSSVGGYTPAVLAKVLESVKETTGFDLTEVMKASTYDAQVNRNVQLSGVDSVVNVNMEQAKQPVPVSASTAAADTTTEA
jgi:flotillin